MLATEKYCIINATTLYFVDNDMQIYTLRAAQNWDILTKIFINHNMFVYLHFKLYVWKYSERKDIK